MMAYSMPILTAAIVFGIVAVAIWIPWLIYTYRKYGYLPLSVLVISFSFIFYSLAAFF